MFAIARSPIMQSELTYQRRWSRTWRWRRARWWRWLRLPIYAILMAILVASLAAFWTRDRVPENLWALPIRVHLLVTYGAHFLVVMQTLVLASNAITREKAAGTWDMLLLTGVDTRELVGGKWWATLRQMGYDYAVLAALRAALVVALGSGYGPPEPDVRRIVFACLTVGVYTALEAGFSAALGLVASLLISRRIGGLMLALALRGLVVVIGLLGSWSLSVGTLLSLLSPVINLPIAAATAARPLFACVMLAQVDNGTWLTGWLASTVFEAWIPIYLVSSQMGLGLFTLLTALAVRLAQMLAARQGVNRPTGADDAESV